MMTDAQTVLGADFAHRVVERVRQSRRRRRIYRWALTTTLACMLVAAGLLHFSARNSEPAGPMAGTNDGPAALISVPAGFTLSRDNPSLLIQPLAFFFPGATSAADFESSEASYWHSYDSWWDAKGWSE
jgi:hypothetical protein